MSESKKGLRLASKTLSECCSAVMQSAAEVHRPPEGEFQGQGQRMHVLLVACPLSFPGGGVGMVPLAVFLRDGGEMWRNRRVQPHIS